MKLPKTKKMTVKAFIAIPDNPRQRDTARHARRAIGNHLKEYSPTHSRVEVAELNGKYYKLNGHTRALLWKQNKLEKPPGLLADIYPCDSMAEVIELYAQFDNSKATETVTDKIHGALRYYKIHVNSHNSPIAKQGLKTAMTNLELLALGFPNANGVRRVSEMDYVEEYKKELTIFLSGDLKAERLISARMVRISSAMIAASLLTIRRHGNMAMAFWEAVNNDLGTKSKSGRDGVQIYTDYMQLARANHEIGMAIFNFRHIEIGINCYEMWRAGRKSNAAYNNFYTKGAHRGERFNGCKNTLLDYGYDLSTKIQSQTSLPLE